MLVSKVWYKRGAWLASTAICALLSTGASAQEAQTSEVSELEEIIVVGTRQAIKDSEDIKRNSESIVDSITATDIGAFPDRSIAEALQRVPGVSVIRTADPTDVTHYTAEPSGVVIRGLTQTRSEFNGRDVFSANSGYGLQYEDISPALVARVDTFKNQTAEMIEGGIAGTINIVTSVPFDNNGRVLTGNIAANYGDISGQVTPDVSGVYSDTWDTNSGRFGLLVSGTHSELVTSSRGAVQGRTLIFDPGTYSDSSGNAIDRELYIPSGVFFTETEYDRVRDGLSIAGQWESPDQRFLATAQYSASRYENTWRERLQENYWKFVQQGTPHTTTINDPFFVLSPEEEGGTFGANGASSGDPFTFQSNGLFGMGTINQTFGGAGDWGYGAVDWSSSEYPFPYLEGGTDNLGVLSNGVAQTEPCIFSADVGRTSPCPRAVEVLTKTRYAQEKRSIDDVSLNFKWTPTDQLKFNFDYQHVEADTSLDDIVVGFKTFADVRLDLTSGLPQLTWMQPSYYNQIGTSPFTNPENYAVGNVMDHITDSTGSLDAFRADAAYEVDTPWVEEIRAGFRVADRRQEHKWSAYNWNTVSAAWNTVNQADSFQLNSGPTFNADSSLRFPGYEPGFYESVSFGQDILGGGLVGNQELLFMNFDFLENDDWVRRNFSAVGQEAAGGTASAYWNPICYREGEISGSCFTQGEIVDVEENTKALYAMAMIGGDDAKVFGYPVSGNVGLRYVEIENTSSGAINFPIAFDAGSLDCVANPVTNSQIIACATAGAVDDQAFSSGSSASSVTSSTNGYALPSANFRVELGEQTYLRMAASRALSKPDIGLLKNYTQVRRTGITSLDSVADGGNIVYDGAGNAIDAVYSYAANSGNPRLKPIQATQFDVSLEHYFEPVGSLTAVLFYKELDDYIQNGTFIVPVTHNGVTRNIATTAPVNGDGASLKGFELQFRRYFDDVLPAPFDGLGIEANYTRVMNQGVSNANLVADTTGENAVAFSSQSGMIDPGRLENLSDHTANIVGIYEKGKFGGRLAYNWRSEYLISVNDCCVGFPVWSDDEGFLDASLRYAISDNLELSFQGSNLLEQRAETKAQVRGPTDDNPNQESVFLPASTFEYDRRFQIGLRAKF